ncbi:hypothetical protein [uncultured Corynebacterium sp.]|uniref:hypothetical protein n=1 Tax=uncultured Corynebacterium sp. TaxID=159447 RepID=UPI00259A1377|nr:hypothetical protein [uncultured Corynebacterium sp.]
MAWMQPDAVIPASAPGELLLIRTDEVAVSIGNICAYPNGFEFTAHVRRRGQDANEPGWHDPFGRFGQHGLHGSSSDDSLQLGLLYADGRRGATTGGLWAPGDPQGLMLMPGGAGGSARRWDGKFWVHPLPPEGPMTFVAAWSRYAVAETHAELDASAIRAASARAVTLWPEESQIGASGGGWSSQTLTAFKADQTQSETQPPHPQR